MADLSAVTGQDTLTLIVEGGITLLTLVTVGLKIAGKPVPVLDTILGVLRGVQKQLPPKSDPLPPPSDPAKEPGLAKVIDIKPEGEKPPEAP